MSDPTLVAGDALVGVDVGISVSDSADLARLGLDHRHAELAIGELARAVLLAGGRLTYGGRIRPSGFTQQLMNEVTRYGTTRHSLTICLALPEHRKLDLSELREVDAEFSTWGRLVTLDLNGTPISWKQGRKQAGAPIEDPDVQRKALTGLRRHLASSTDAQVLLGGQLSGFQGATPGLIEEAVLAIEASHPVYLAGGFGGAAAAAAKALGVDAFDWLPESMPAGASDPLVASSLRLLSDTALDQGWTPHHDGLTAEENRILASSHRPGEIASLVVLGIASAVGGAARSTT
jgi:hypothetical protein